MMALASYLRMGEWIDSKVPMMLGILLYFGCLAPQEAILLPVLALFLYSAMFLAASYVVNDLSDLEADRLAGKKKVIACLPLGAVWLSLAMMLLIGNLPLLLITEHKLLCGTVMLVTYFFGLAYSMPFLRFKEKGLWGLLECSFAQRCMPLFVLPFVCRITLWPYLLWLLVSFLNGLRYILIHQHKDRENDLLSGVRTYVTSGAKHVRGTIACCFALEAILSTALLLPLWSAFPATLVIGILVELVLEYSTYKVLHVYAQKDWLTIFDSVPLDGYDNIIFPLMTAVMAGLRSPGVLCAAVLLICLNLRAIPIKLKFIWIYLRSIFRK